MSKYLQRTAAVALLATAFGLAHAADIAVKLTGAQEVPAIMTDAQGLGTITIASDMSVSGSVTTTGIMGTVAHIHMAEMGKNGPVIIALTKTSDNVWSVPAGSKLTEEQYAAFKAGNLYVNVHSDAHKPGEIRAQLKP
jgi:hypothetical protein